MKRHIDYAPMTFWEKRRVLKLEKKANNRKTYRELQRTGKTPKRGISWFKVIIFIALVAAAYYFREEIIEFVKGLF